MSNINKIIKIVHKSSILFITLFLLFVLLFKYFIFKFNSKTDVNNTISYVVNGKRVDQLDESKSYRLIEQNCNNSVTAVWNDHDKKFELSKAKNTKCTLKFSEVINWYEDISSHPNYLTTKMLTAEMPYADNVSSPYVTAASGISFTAISSNTNGKGLYYTTDENDTQDGSRVYYYRGNIDNNHVKFANFCWRIVRTNEDGSVRMRYNGTPKNDGTCPRVGETVSATYMKNGSTQVGYAVKFNANATGNQYVGYMYGTNCTNSYNECHSNENDSTIKTFIDEWYQYTIESNSIYNNKVAMTNFCNDRSIISKEEIENIDPNLTNYVGNGIGTTTTWYKPYERVFNGTPTYKCPQANDIFSLKAGLLTVDEAMYAGLAKVSDNTNVYLYISAPYWLMSPRNSNPITREFLLGPYATISTDAVSSVKNANYNMNYYVLPVISLEYDTLVTGGTGVHNDPYTV